MKILVIDSDKSTASTVEDHLTTLGKSVSVVWASNLNKALDIISHQMITAIFLDPKVPAITEVIEFKKLHFKTPIVAVVDEIETCLEIQDFNVVGFLKKPLDMVPFSQCLTKIKEQISLCNPCWRGEQNFYVKEKGIIERIDLSNVLYIEAEGNYCSFKASKSNPFLKHLTLQSLHPILPNGFQQVHRSFIVNLKKIEKVETQTIFLEGGKRIPIGKLYRRMLQQALGFG